MGNISLHTTTGATVEPFLLEGPKFEFCNTEYEQRTAEQNKKVSDECLKCEEETNTEPEKHKENSQSAFQNNANSDSFKSDTSSAHAFSQPSNYDFQSYS